MTNTRPVKFRTVAPSIYSVALASTPGVEIGRVWRRPGGWWAYTDHRGHGQSWCVSRKQAVEAMLFGLTSSLFRVGRMPVAFPSRGAAEQFANARGVDLTEIREVETFDVGGCDDGL